MYQIEFKIVGLPYHAWGDERLGERVRTALGKRVTLTHDCDNEKNPEATMVVIDTQFVGYVSNEQCHVVSRYCDESVTKTLQAVVVDYEARDEHFALWARAEVEKSMDMDAVGEHAEARLWSEKYSWLAMMPKSDDARRLKALVGEIKRVLLNGEGMEGENKRVFDAYLRDCRWDVSWEATQEREELQRLSAESEHEDMREWSRRLSGVMTKMGSEQHLEEIYVRVFEETKRSRAFQKLHRMHEDLEHGALRQALMRFPGWMYQYFGKMEKWEYMSTLYYMRLPEAALMRFVTGVLMEQELMAKAKGGKRDDVPQGKVVLLKDGWSGRRTQDEHATEEGNEVPMNREERLKRVIEQMREEQCFRHQYDYVWLMIVMNKTEGMPHFDGLQSFTDYLHDDLGFTDAPARSTMHSKMYVCQGGKRPDDWTFSDTQDSKECHRRINVAKRFLRQWEELKMKNDE